MSLQKLTSEELKLCDELFAVVCPSMESVTSTEWRDKLDTSAQRAFSLVTGSQKHVVGDSDGSSFLSPLSYDVLLLVLREMVISGHFHDIFSAKRILSFASYSADF